MKRSGFTLIEVLLVVGMLTAITGFTVPAYREFQMRSDLDRVTQQVSQGLSRARLLATSGEQTSAWGFYVPAGVLYKGASYSERDASYDEVYPMPSSIAVAGLLDVSYGHVTGLPSATGDITLRALSNDERVIQVRIAVDEQSLVTNQTDILTICHHPGLPTQQTTTIPDAGWPGHQSHGDTIGSCEGGGSSSSAVASSAPASSSSSSAPASSSSSSAGGGSSGCSTFTVDSNQLITLTAASSVTFTNKLALITFGSGGPDVNVHVCYSKNNSESLSPLFGGTGSCSGHGNAYGNAVQPNGTDTTTKNLSSGDQIVLQVNGQYRSHGWLAFDETYISIDQSSHVRYLYNGDTLGDYPGFASQTALRTYLQGQGMVNGSDIVTIGACDILSITELGTLGSSGADFQDDVLLMQFN